MEEFCQYNLFKKVRPPLFTPPGYLRDSERRGDFKKAPTLKLRASDPSKLLFLCESLQDTCCRELEMKINYFFMEELDCTVAFMIKFQPLPNEGLLNVINATPLEKSISMPSDDSLFEEIKATDEGLQFPFDNLNAQLMEAVKNVVPDASADVFVFAIHEQFNKNGITEFTKNVSFLMFIIGTSYQKLFVSQMVKETFRFVSPILNNTAAYERQSKIKDRLQSVMTASKKLFALIENFNDLKQCLKESAMNIFESERCDIFLLDKTKKKLEEQVMCDGVIQMESVPINRGVIGYVVSHNKHLNIKKAYDSPLFLKADDERCNFTTRNILCCPIFGTEVMGALQLRNKNVGDYNIYDENAAILLGTLGGLALKWSKIFNSLFGYRKRLTIANGLIHYDIKVYEGEINHLISGVQPKEPELSSLQFNGRDVPEHRTGLLIMRMFDDFDLFAIFNIKRKRLATFLAYIMKGYFDHPYHNWMQAFAATQFCYSIISTLDLIDNEILSHMEVLCLLVSCICCNVDHRGFANAFRLPQTSTLGSLYTSAGSVMEWHHFTQFIVILNKPECNFLTGLEENQYRKCLELIKYYILCTDYVNYLKYKQTQEGLLAKNFRPKLNNHKLHFCSLMMICSQFCDQIRSWETVRNVASQCYKEYFKQGELEKEMGKQPLEIMDKEKACIPTMEIDFLKEICLPPFTLLAIVLPEMQFCVDEINNNINRWTLAKQYFTKRNVKNVTSLDLLLGNPLSLANLEKKANEAYEDDVTESYEENEIEEEEFSDDDQ